MRKPRPSRNAFTLIETLAVVALLAVLTTAVTVSLAGAARAARVEDVAERFVAFDRSTRDAARQFGRTPALQFDLNRGTVHRIDGEREAAPLHLGGGVRVTRVFSRGRDSGSGEAAVRFSPLGQTPSYAVRLVGRSGECWVAFVGLTGQPLVLRDEREVQDILSLVAASSSPDRPDAP
jgi:prepilin-type N-terminal cleavage/methylation domain-containing protein